MGGHCPIEPGHYLTALEGPKKRGADPKIRPSRLWHKTILAPGWKDLERELARERNDTHRAVAAETGAEQTRGRVRRAGDGEGVKQSAGLRRHASRGSRKRVIG